jgi:predicted XRE-type DNA-binding protein
MTCFIVMKNYTEAKNVKEIAKILKVTKAEASKVEIRTNLAIAIRRAIEKKGLTHLKAAQKSSVGRTVITSIMNGNTLHISTERLIDIAQSLGLTITLKVA